jgi:ABC-2 type transport system ATP-binding protein
MTTIQARGLTKRFGNDVLAVDNLDFDVVPGGVTGFLGPNGAGKTTTLRMLLGLVTPTSGSVLIGGQTYRHLHAPTRRVGAVLEASGFHPARTARNHLKLIATVAGIPYSRVDECLDLVGLADAKNRTVGAFSMGMRQRLELARALLGAPDILILDEPSNGLDPQGIVWLREFLKWFASEGIDKGGEGRIVVVSSHLLSEAQLTVDHVIILAGGRLAAQGRLRELLANTKRTVRVRTPDADRLVQALGAANLNAKIQDGYVECEGGTPEVVGRIMLDDRILVLDMHSDSESLEELFFSLTDSDASHPGHGAALMGDFTSSGASDARAMGTPGVLEPPAVEEHS